MPDRAKQYFKPGGHFPFEKEDFANACDKLGSGFEGAGPPMVAALADHLDRIISHQDLFVGIIAEGAYEHQKTTRVAAIVSAQAWHLADADEGKKYGADKGVTQWFALVELIEKTHPKLIRKDPISQWQQKANRLRNLSTAPTEALKQYDAFISQTEFAREAIAEAAAACEAEIDAAIDRARGK